MSSIVIAAANTGSARTRSTAVIATDHTNKGIRPDVIPLGRMFFAVVIKLMEAKMEDTPARWREKIARSTAGPE